MQKGFLTQAGIKPASTWGTAVAVGSSDGFVYETLNAKPGRDLIMDSSVGAGRRTPFQGFAGNYQLSSNSITMPLRFGGYNVKRFIAGVLGTAGSPSTTDTSAKKHTLAMAQDLTGVFFTIAGEPDKDNEVWEFSTCKITRLVLSGQIGQGIKLQASFAAHGFSNSSSTNDTTSIDSITLGSDGTEECLMSQLQFLINAQSGGSFTAPSGTTLNDSMAIEGFELTIDPKVRVDKFNTLYGSNQAEPIQEDHTDIRLNLKFSEYGSGNKGKQIITDNLAKSARKAKIAITSPNLAGAASQYYQHNIWMPYLQVVDGAPELAADKGEPKWDATLVAMEVTSAPTGFSYTKALTWEVFDKDSANPLA